MTLPALLLTATAGTAAALAGAATAGTIALTRRVTLPGKPKLIPLTLGDGRVTFERTPTTLLPGEYGVWVNDGRGHLRVGAVLNPTERTSVVRRELLAATGDTDGATEGRWTGHAYPDPAALGYDYETVTIPTPTGEREAWLIAGEDPEHWVIHVHGLKSSRASALRGVPAAQQAGATSLVVSYYGEAHPAQHEHTEGATFGVIETGDVEAALSYALAHGARRVSIVGWSMGAGIALHLAEHSPHRESIERLVLVGPALDWRGSISRAMAAKKLPGWVQKGVLAALGTRVFSRAARMSAAADFPAHTWTRRKVTVRTLVIHSTGDTDAVFADSVGFAAANPGVVSVQQFEPVPHLLEWNAEPDLFDRVVSRHLSAAASPSTPGHTHPAPAVSGAGRD